MVRSGQTPLSCCGHMGPHQQIAIRLSRLYRFFDDVRWAEQLMLGSMRCRTLAYYRGQRISAHTKLYGQIGPIHKKLTRRNRKALAITDTELSVIAALAIIGLRRIPNHG